MKAATQSEISTIAAGEFKAKCLQLIDDVSDGMKEVVITKHGVAKARLVPIKEQKKPFLSVVGRCGPIRVMEDLITPLPEEYTIPIDPFLG